MKYLRSIPRIVPAGRIVVHNQVHPAPFPDHPFTGLGVDGFQAWTEREGTPRCIVCHCGWASWLTEHYRVQFDS